MFRANELGTAPLGVLRRNLNGPVGPGRPALEGVHPGVAHAHALFQYFFHQIIRQPCLGQHCVGDALLLPEKAKKQVLRAHIAVAQRPGRLLGELHDRLGLGGELLFVHRYSPFL